MSNKKVRQADLEYIGNHASDMSERELANALNLSKTTVHRIRKRLGMVGVDAPGRNGFAEAETGPSEDVDRAVFLRRHVRRLEQRMPGASDSALAMLSKEYRASLEELASIEGAGAREEKPRKNAEVTPFDVIVGRNARLGKAAKA